jgi:hypothetical protein
MPDLVRHPDVVPTKVGNHFKDWFLVFTGNPGFRLEFIPMKIGAGMTVLIEGVIYKQTLIKSKVEVKPQVRLRIDEHED